MCVFCCCCCHLQNQQSWVLSLEYWLDKIKIKNEADQTYRSQQHTKIHPSLFRTLLDRWPRSYFFLASLWPCITVKVNKTSINVESNSTSHPTMFEPNQFTYVWMHASINPYATAPTASLCSVKLGQPRHSTAGNWLCRQLTQTQWGCYI